MIKLLFILIVLTCLGMAAAWIAEHPGNVTIYWFDYRIDTSFAFVLLVATVGAVIVAFIYHFLRTLALAPTHISQAQRLKRYDRGIAELTYSVAALATSDIRTAELHTKKAEKLLGNKSPITLLLSAQIARNKGDDNKTRQLLEKMLEHKETEYLAARSLSEAASKQQMFPKALAMAERAQKANPKGSTPVIGLHIRLGQWQEALRAIRKQGRGSITNRDEAKRQRGLVHLQHGIELLTDGYPEAALESAHLAVRDLGNFSPAILLLAHAYNANNNRKKAIAVLLKTCKTAPHAQLADTARELIAEEPTQKQAALLNKLEAMVPIDVNDASWLCNSCGHTQRQWNALCPSCNNFDSFQWKKREMSFV